MLYVVFYSLSQLKNSSFTKGMKIHAINGVRIKRNGGF
jgi:hypothetical protein